MSARAVETMLRLTGLELLVIEPATNVRATAIQLAEQVRDNAIAAQKAARELQRRDARPLTDLGYEPPDPTKLAFVALCMGARAAEQQRRAERSLVMLREQT